MNQYYITKAYTRSWVPVWNVREGISGMNPLGPSVFETKDETEALAYLKEVQQ